MRDFSCLVAFLAVVVLSVSSADGETSTDWNAIMAEAEWDWRPGDLIFRNDLNANDELIRDAEGGKWASIGILRASSGSPRVIFADETEGVTELMLEEFVGGLSQSDYAVYRVNGVNSELPDGQQIQGPLATYGIFVAYGSPYDTLYRFGNGRYYSAELPFEAALSAGVVLGHPRPLSEMASPTTALGQLLLKGWGDNPYCVAATSAEQCWDMISNASIATPQSLIASGKLEKVYPE